MKKSSGISHKISNSEYEWKCSFTENLDDEMPQKIKFLRYANTGEKFKLKNIITWKDLCEQIVNIMKSHNLTKVMSISHMEKSGDSVIFYTDYFR